jgi:hypothetical protein
MSIHRQAAMLDGGERSGLGCHTRPFSQSDPAIAKIKDIVEKVAVEPTNAQFTQSWFKSQAEKLQC